MRDYTRLRADLTQERARHYQRLEKLLEDALIKVSSVASKLDGLSVRDMLEALIAGERDPAVLAGLARGKLKALVAIARSILVIVWHLLADPTARYHDLGAGYYASRIDKDKKARNHIRQLQALGFAVTLTPAAA